ncbi:MAG: hypothetical protein NTW87_33775 [Planctomycetota bacterium]|nr:hypothetical protein [Planctomycetota bacterium]
MDEKPKKRPWFQFHLSTAIVLMFMAGAFLLANPTPTRYGSQPNDVGYGWPVVLTERSMHGDPFGPADLWPWWWYGVLALDVLVPMNSMILTTIAMEWLIRRRARRQ